MLKRIIAVMTIAGTAACGRSDTANTPVPAVPAVQPAAAERPYMLERVDEAAVVQVYAD